MANVELRSASGAGPEPTEPRGGGGAESAFVVLRYNRVLRDNNGAPSRNNDMRDRRDNILCALCASNSRICAQF